MNQATMVAAVFEHAGHAAEVVQLQRIAVPEPAPGEVLVRMQAASLHPADHLFMAGTYRMKPVFPQRAGLVGAGEVVRCGAGVHLPEGTRVAFRHPGAWADFCTVPAGKLFVVPAGIDSVDACQFALNPLTAWALLASVGARRGDWLAMNAARSNVAGMVRGLAEARGLRVVDIPGPAAADDGQASGSPAQELLAVTGGEPVAALLDAVGGPQLLEVMPALRQGAVIVSYGVLASAPAPIHNADLIYRNLSWQGFGIDHWLARHADGREAMAAELWRAIAEGTVPLPVRARYPLGAIGDALRADAAGGAGKVVLVLGDEA